MKRVTTGLPRTPIVDPKAVDRLQKAWAERKSKEEAEKFWERLQASKQPTVDWEQLPV